VAEERPVSDTLLDWLVYAPLGAATILVEELPRLAERGRERFERQIGAAELIGRLAVAEARRRLTVPPSSQSREAVPSSRSQAESRSPLQRPARPAPSSSPQAAQGPLPTQAHEAEGTPHPRGGGTRRPPESAHHVGRTEDNELPIPAYDTLAASQVVERLASLSPAELETVRKHESVTRRRRTVLHRIAQLNAERDGATA
jgi:hypothetical protein